MKSILLAATALAMLCGPAFAQTSQSNSGSNATVNTASGSQSQSVSNPRVNVIGNPIGNGASSSNSGAKATSNTRSASRAAAVGNTTNVTVSGYAGVDGSGNSTGSGSTGSGSTGSGSNGAAGTGSNGSSSGNTGSNSVNYGGSYTIRNTPEVIPPSVVGGNPCAVGASGGLSLPGFGVALGGTWADKACERRQQAALLFNMGEQKVAYEMMCQDDNVRAAMRSASKPCIADTAPVAQAPAPTMAQAPAVQAPAAPIVMAAVHTPAAPRPEWCARAKPDTEASKAYFAQICK
jgi:hypothetical protein